MEKKTPLYDLHLELGGKIVPFAGYLLPVQYQTGVIKEHMAVRTACGLFDVSHMGEILIKGPDALSNLQRFLTNDFADMDIGRVRYSPICNEKGGIVDDLIVYKFAQDEYFLVVNAANKDKDYAWFTQHAKGDVQIIDLSDHYAQLALQGPKAKDILSKLTDADKLPTKYYSFVRDLDVSGVPCLVSRTGYTGELGYELYCAPDKVVQLAKALLEAGADEGLIPCGLGARDTLRLEAGMPLYGHEMSDEITPFEVGLDFFVKMDKDDFIGKQALQDLGEPQRVRVGLVLTDRGIAREESDVYHEGRKVGVTTSGTLLPYTNKASAMALVQKDIAQADTEVEIDVRGRRLKAKVVDLPFYKRT
ncbi:MAG: glycine cleavage system aminomethyltransferase GcvT [Clostridiales bacterium]|jgi:aminomethyltransferase|nr:glycine cleavage system aminomethyltransferase GcvT [Clostridiales bacterium]HHT07169.1 glycine cleavage system aminomethyltransferase GcvT [Clostridiales bacterium]